MTSLMTGGPAGQLRRIFIKAFIRLCLFSGVFGLLAACGPNAEDTHLSEVQSGVQADATFYLVRHAEKELDGKDPALSPEGYLRANALAQRVKDIKLTAVYSTDTRRTRDTGAQVLKQKKMKLDLYDGRDLEAFAKTFADKRGHYLIVGHSNTTPQLAKALGGEGGDPIVEATEYDRFYVLRRTGGVIVTELQRY